LNIKLFTYIPGLFTVSLRSWHGSFGEPRVIRCLHVHDWHERGVSVTRQPHERMPVSCD